MRKRWYVSLMSIGVALNAVQFGRMAYRRSRSCQPKIVRLKPIVTALATQPERPVARLMVPPPPASVQPVAPSHQLPQASILSRVAIGVLLIAAILLAVRAQSMFEMQYWDERDLGIPYAIAAMIAFSAVAFLADRWLGKSSDITDCPTAPHKINAPAKIQIVADIRSGVQRHRWRTAGIITSSVMILLVLNDLRSNSPLTNYVGALILWLAAIVLFALSIVILQPRHHRDWKTWWQQNWLWVAAVTGIGILALLLRLYNLAGIPQTMGGDEGSQGVEALKILNGELLNPFVTSWMSVPTMSFFFNALTIGPLGNTALALRLPWALIGTATVLVVFALSRRLKGLSMGLLAGMLLAAYHYHIHYSRLGSNQVADVFFMAAAFFFLYRAYDDGGLANWVLAGLVAGLAQYFYAGARFTPIMVGVTIISFIVRERRPFVRTHWRGLVALAAMFLITAGPMLQFAAHHPDEYDGRLNAVGIFQSGWLTREVQITGRSETDLLLDQFKRVVLAYNAYPDRTAWYGSPRPLFDGLWAILFILGLGYATLRPFDRRLFPMLMWWWGAIILGGMLTESPPSSQRLITAAAPAVFFVALAVWKSGQIVQRLFQRAPRESAAPKRTAQRYILPGVTALIVSVLCWLSVNWYFVEYTPMRVYGNYTAVTADVLVRYAEEHLTPSDRIVFFGAPQMYIDFGSIKYLLPQTAGQDITESLTAPFDPKILPDEKRPIFMFVPYRHNELAFVQQTYPNGRVEELPSPLPGADAPILYIYRLN